MLLQRLHKRRDYGITLLMPLRWLGHQGAAIDAFDKGTQKCKACVRAPWRPQGLLDR